jgi:DNA-binding NtrC family response regulator
MECNVESKNILLVDNDKMTTDLVFSCLARKNVVSNYFDNIIKKPIDKIYDIILIGLNDSKSDIDIIYKLIDNNSKIIFMIQSDRCERCEVLSIMRKDNLTFIKKPISDAQFCSILESIL